MKKKSTKVEPFAETLYITRDYEDVDDPIYLAHESLEDAVDQNDPKVVATYQLVGAKVYRRVIEEG